MSEHSKTSGQASSSGELSKCSKRGMQKGNFCEDNKNKLHANLIQKTTVNCTVTGNVVNLQTTSGFIWSTSEPH